MIKAPDTLLDTRKVQKRKDKRYLSKYDFLKEKEKNKEFKVTIMI